MKYVGVPKIWYLHEEDTYDGEGSVYDLYPDYVENRKPNNPKVYKQKILKDNTVYLRLVSNRVFLDIGSLDIVEEELLWRDFYKDDNEYSVGKEIKIGDVELFKLALSYRNIYVSKIFKKIHYKHSSEHDYRKDEYEEDIALIEVPESQQEYEDLMKRLGVPAT